MRKFLHLTAFHFKRIIKKPEFLAMTALMPFLIIAFYLFLNTTDTSAPTDYQNIAVINESSAFSENIYPELTEEIQDLFTENKDETLQELSNAELDAVYVIPENFPTGDGTISSYSLNGENRNLLFESQFTNELGQILKNQAYESAGVEISPPSPMEPEIISSGQDINSNLVFILFMLSFFIVFGSSYISISLVNMRETKLLKRSVVSNTKSWQVMASVLGANVIYLLGVNILMLILLSLFFNVPLSHFEIILSTFLSMIIFSVGLSMVLFRLFKNAEVILVIGAIVPMILFSLILIAGAVPSLETLQYLSPYYWIGEALDTGNWVLPTSAVSLYGVVLFTAGNFKIEQFVDVK